MAKVKVAVLGTGSLGQHHARIYSELHAAGQVQLTGIYDSHPETARKVADKHKLHVFASVAEAAAASDALNIVTPTKTHFDIAKALLAQGKHVLVEKPMTDNSEQAAELIQVAQQKNCVLQVGHVERFNPVFKYMESVATQPRFIECHRLSPFPARSTDIGVVLDLMIHDLDVILAFVKSPVVSVDGVGIPVLSKTEDIANVRLRFANGCLANLTASRVSPERMRKIRVFSGPDNPCYISLNYQAQEGFIYRVAQDGAEESSWLKMASSPSSASARIPPSSANSPAKKSCANPSPLPRRSRSNSNSSTSSNVSKPVKNRWSAANPPSSPSTSLLRSPARFNRLNDFR